MAKRKDECCLCKRDLYGVGRKMAFGKWICVECWEDTVLNTGKNGKFSGSIGEIGDVRVSVSEGGGCGGSSVYAGN